MATTSHNSHPACCLDPDNCTLSYRDHLVGFSIAAVAIPTRSKSDVLSGLVREKRWHRDMDAYKRLRKDGIQPPQIDGSALRERQGQDIYDVEHRPITIDYSDAS